MYKIPTMKEVESIDWNGLNVVSTFSGAGGSCLGYRMAGYKVLWANEFVPKAQEVYKANHPDSILCEEDIRQVSADDILDELGLEVGELDLLDGSPPCSSFSSSGTREKGWGQVKKYSDREQRTDDLFYEYARLLRGLRPKVFVAENVSGLVKGTAKGQFVEIMRELQSCGYNVKAKMLDAKFLGVPQSRQRLIFIGVRDDIDLEPVFPKPLKQRPFTTKDVLPHVHFVKHSGKKENWKLASRRSHPTVVASGGQVSPTAYFSGGTYVRDVDHVTRKLTIEELKLICSFPEDFVLTGDFAQQWERLGRSVPPLMMKEIAMAIKTGVLDHV